MVHIILITIIVALQVWFGVSRTEQNVIVIMQWYCVLVIFSLVRASNYQVVHVHCVGYDGATLTHCGRVMHICVSKLTIIGSDNGLSPGRRQAIIWTNAGILLIGPLGTNFSEILIEILTFSCKKMHLKPSSVKWQPFCFGLNVLKHGLSWRIHNVIMASVWYRSGYVLTHNTPYPVQWASCGVYFLSILDKNYRSTIWYYTCIIQTFCVGVLSICMCFLSKKHLLILNI